MSRSPTEEERMMIALGMGLERRRISRIIDAVPEYSTQSARALADELMKQLLESEPPTKQAAKVQLTVLREERQPTCICMTRHPLVGFGPHHARACPMWKEY